MVDPVLDVWKALPPRKFPNYAAGTWGPKEADDLMLRDEREWRKIEAMILAGEIGATKTRLAAFENEGNRLNTVVEKIYSSQQESSLLDIISNFVKTEGIPVHSACFGVAGPVRGRTKQDFKPGVDDRRRRTGGATQAARRSDC